MKTVKIYLLMIFLFVCLGCFSATKESGNTGQVQSYPVPTDEPEWIRNGEPIEFEGETWYPVDGIENFLDSEVDLVGEYRNVQYFVDKIDVKPYDRLYTKFGKNKFRIFEFKEEHD